MKKKLTFFFVLMAIAMGAKAEDYKLRVTGITVTDENKSDILGDGTVSFDSSEKRLTFINADIEYQGTIVSCWDENLTVQFIGSNTLTAKSRYGGYTTIIGAYNGEYDDVTLTLTGPGTLIAYGNISGTSGNTYITGGLKLTLMNGVISTSVKEAHLVFSGVDTQVKAYHDTDYCIISNFYSMTLDDDLQITQPEGAYYDATTYRLRDKDGNEVQKQWVTIEKEVVPTQDVVIRVRNGMSEADLTPVQYVSLMAMWRYFGALQLAETSTDYVYKNMDGKELCYISKTTGQLSLAEGVTSADNVYHEITDEDREAIKGKFIEIGSMKLSYETTLAPVKSIALVLAEGAVTGIDAVNAGSSDKAVYTLGGQRIKGQPTHKGIYLVNGRKVLVE